MDVVRDERNHGEPARGLRADLFFGMKSVCERS
jgi:hypothetical protein